MLPLTFTAAQAHWVNKRRSIGLPLADRLELRQQVQLQTVELAGGEGRTAEAAHRGGAQVRFERRVDPRATARTGLDGDHLRAEPTIEDSVRFQIVHEVAEPLGVDVPHGL
jgi:hypothetical protein